MELILDNNDIKIGRMQLGTWATNSYVVICPKTGNSALIDVPDGAEAIVSNLKGTHLKYMLLTHSHIDHIAGLEAIRKLVDAPLAVHPADNRKEFPFPPEILLQDGDVIGIGKVNIEVLHTPGHTSGSLCFKIGEHLLSGDTLFAGGPGRTASPSDFSQIVESITEKIFVLSDGMEVYPGHGESTVLKKEKAEFTVFSGHPHSPDLFGDVVWLNS